ncbi:glycoside hydrolase family 78 protein [Sunxiuqinia rutila]|uniref:glycoside hydrolase family 78 protein n=1 Tax=Sunxiuqinia rutila TaxID=1397841 RepID=UPI003D35B738
MKNIRFTILSVFLLLVGASCFAQFEVVKLRCEHLENPLGIDGEQPRFSWQLQAEKDGILQAKYQLWVGTDLQEVKAGKGNIWNSGEVVSARVPAIYSGPKLSPFTRYFWAVKVQDEVGNWSDLSEAAHFETGMMNKDNWQGSWISDTYDYNLKSAPYFRKEFKVSKKVKAARAYIAVAGLYELMVNGEKVGNHRLDPMYTRFDRRNLYVTYDLTNSLNEGNNAIGVLLGNGWYNHQSTAVWYFDKAPWRARPKFCMDVRIVYEDGSEETVRTRSDWKTTASPVIFNSIYTAEHYDARLELPGWNKPGFDDSKWGSVLLTGAPSENTVAQTMVPVRHVEELPVQNMKKLDENTYLFDFGRNISGVTQMTAQGPEGTTIRLKHAERLTEKGYADLSNIDVHYRPTDDTDPFQTDIFILSGKKKDTFLPRFNYKGFQYVEVTSDQPLELSPENLTAYFMHSDVPPVGTIYSSNETLNKTWQAANSSYLANLFGYPTDCPQREKNGWTGDAHINIETGLYNYDAITVYEKWMADHRDEQQPNGVLPAIIPTSGWGYQWANGPDWTSTIAIIPWNIYLFYGDRKVLADCYDNIKQYVDYIDTNWPSGITDWGLGDWVPVKSKAPKEFTSTAYYYADVVILSKAAKLLGKEGDYQKYQRLAEKIRQALNAKYLDREKGIYGSGLQTELSVALYWGLVPEELVAKVAVNLAKRVEADNKHLDVGLLGTKTILNALSENGYADLAYELATQEDFPSWGWWIVNGATTFYENWPLDAQSDISMNHIMFGEVNAWYYKGLGGIFPDEQQPGFKNIILKPNFVKGLTFFNASHEGPYGEIVSAWKRDGRKISYQVRVPANSTATLYLESDNVMENGKSITRNELLKVVKSEGGGLRISLMPGEYDFTIR